MNQTTFERGIEKGIEKGRQQERTEFVRSLLEERFGVLPSMTCDRLQEMSMPELRSLTLRIAAAASLADLGLPE